MLPPSDGRLSSTRGMPTRPKRTKTTCSGCRIPLGPLGFANSHHPLRGSRIRPPRGPGHILGPYGRAHAPTRHLRDRQPTIGGHRPLPQEGCRAVLSRKWWEGLSSDMTTWCSSLGRGLGSQEVLLSKALVLEDPICWHLGPCGGRRGRGVVLRSVYPFTRRGESVRRHKAEA